LKSRARELGKPPALLTVSRAMTSPVRALGWMGVSLAGGIALLQAAPVVEFKLPPPPPPTEVASRRQQNRNRRWNPWPPLRRRRANPSTTWLEAQIELARRGFSSGAIDGVGGAQSAAASKAFQEFVALEPTGALDRPTRAALQLTAPAFTEVTLTAEDLALLQPLSDTWLGKSQQSASAYETALELVADEHMPVRLWCAASTRKLIGPSRCCRGW